MSKAHDPHWRYVALKMDAPSPLSRRGLGNALKGHFRKLGWPEDDLPNLTRMEWPHAIIKVHHHRLDGARAALAEMDFAIEAAAKVPLQVTTLSSSGTIKALTTRLGILDKRT